MAADPLDLLTLAEAIRALHLPDSFSNDDQLAEIEQMNTGVARDIDDLCGPVVIRNVTEWLSPAATEEAITVAKTPISSVTSIVEWLAGTSTTVTAADEDTSPTNGYLLIGTGHNQSILRRLGTGAGYWQAGDRTVVVTYAAGRYANTAAVDRKFKRVAAAALRAEWAASSPARQRTMELEGDEFAQYANTDAMIRDRLRGELLPSALLAIA